MEQKLLRMQQEEHTDLLAKSYDDIWIAASCVAVGKVDPPDHPDFQEAYQSVHN